MIGATEIVLAAGRLGPVPTAVASAGSPTAIEGARLAYEGGLIVPLLVGDPEAIGDAAGAIGWDISGLRVVPAMDDAAAAAASVALVRGGEARALMKGHLHTDTLLRAVLDRGTGLRCGRRLTHVFHMSLSGRFPPMLITDAAVNVAPDHATMRDIVLNAIDLARILGDAVPRVALLSATEEATSSVPSSVAAAALAHELATETDAKIAGPLGFDNAVSPEAARLKRVNGPVAGRAGVLVVPNIETGNALFKALVHFQGATAAGIVLGAAVPIMLTSRADPPEARLVSAGLARLAAR
jgi:phosphate acetyltransferase